MNHPDSCLETMVTGYAVVLEGGWGEQVSFFIKGRSSAEKARAEEEAEKIDEGRVVLAVTDWNMTKVFVDAEANPKVLCP